MTEEKLLDFGGYQIPFGEDNSGGIREGWRHLYRLYLSVSPRIR